MNKLLTTKQVADQLQVAEITIRKWREKGFPCIKLGRSVRFDMAEVKKWIEDQNK